MSNLFDNTRALPVPPSRSAMTLFALGFLLVSQPSLIMNAFNQLSSPEVAFHIRLLGTIELIAVIVGILLAIFHVRCLKSLADIGYRQVLKSLKIEFPDKSDE